MVRALSSSHTSCRGKTQGQCGFEFHARHLRSTVRVRLAWLEATAHPGDGSRWVGGWDTQAHAGWFGRLQADGIVQSRSQQPHSHQPGLKGDGQEEEACDGPAKQQASCSSSKAPQEEFPECR